MKMKTDRSLLLSLIPLLLITLTGCITVNQQFREVRNKVLGELGDNYKTEFQFSVGPVAIHISSWFVDMAADEEYADDMVREISKVQVGVYNKIGYSDANTNYQTLESIDAEMKSKGWKFIVRSLDQTDLTAIYLLNEPGEVLQKMFVINLEGQELAIIEVTGNLKKVISYAIEEKNFNLKM
ncbi:MAG: DUF4252 domain-containing protein [Ignavibacteria bacterium]|jgi:hypothetical protein